MTCRQCSVPGCQVLLITGAPMCTGHWGRVPQKIKDEMAAAERRAARALTTTGKEIAEIEYRAALDVAASWALGRQVTPTTKAPAETAGPIAG